MLKRASVALLIVVLLATVAHAQSVTPLATVPSVGKDVCAWKQADGRPCNEEFQRCAQGCPCYYPKEDGSCGSAEEAAQEMDRREWDYPSSGVIYDDIVACLKQKGTFNETRSQSIERITEKMLNEGSTLQERGGGCSIQDASSAAGQAWQHIKDEQIACFGACTYETTGTCGPACDAKINPKVNEAKAANVYAWYDWAIESDRQRAFTELRETSTAGTQPADESLESRFQSLEKLTKPVAPETAWDFEGKMIDPQVLKGGLGKSLPSAGIGVAWNDIKPDATAGITFPEGMPITKAILTAGEQVSKGTNSYVTVIDGSTPQLLGTGIPQPEPKRYELKDYIKFDTYLAQEEKHPFKEALFEIAVSSVVSPEFYNSVKMMRWNQERELWNFIPTEKTSGCQSGGKCSLIAKSPGTSVFALVVEKPIEAEDAEGAFPYRLLFIGLGAIAFILVIIAAGIGVLVYAGYWVGKRKNKGK